MVNVIYPNHEISRIITAAVINFRFRQDLLRDPRHAVESGYGDETFSLEEKEIEHLFSIRAKSLEEFATKIIFA